MRLTEVVDLGEGRTVVINELKVKTARNIMASMKLLEEIELKTLLTEQFDKVMALLDDCVKFPDGESLDDLTFSEIGLVKDGFIKVNQAFLDLAGIGVDLLKILSPSLTEPVADLSAEAMPTSSTTAGDSS